MSKQVQETAKSHGDDWLSQVIGHDKDKGNIQNWRARDTLPQALLLAGPRGVGKATLAKAAALQLSETNQRADAGNLDTAVHDAPDVWHGTPANTKMESVRNELFPFLRNAPFVGPRAVVVLEDADAYLTSRQPATGNALLKSLEEPRQRIHFIITASRPDALLPTIT